MDRIGEEFMRRTRETAGLGASDQQRGLPQPPLEMAWDAGLERIPLSGANARAAGAIDLTAAIERRRSVREYSEQPLTLAELSYLLWCSQGVRSVRGEYCTLRTVPSAGARHALETFLVIHRVEGLPAGLYRFLAVNHALVKLREGPGLADELVAGCWGQGFVGEGAAAFLWAADAARMTWRYKQRGYRYLHLDAGHVCQNLYLAAEAVGCGVCAVAAFDDEAMNHLLGLDGEKQFVIYLAAAGKKRSGP